MGCRLCAAHAEQALCDSVRRTRDFSPCAAHVAQVLRDAKVAKADVAEVVLVGGSTRIPKVCGPL